MLPRSVYSDNYFPLIMKKYDYLVVGAGLFGATFTYRAIQAGKKVLVIDKRPHAGGNLYCENINGINVHKYGAHIFHTSNKEVWNFVNRIVEFNRYTNCPVANYKGELYNLPFNMNTFCKIWPHAKTPDDVKKIIESQKEEALKMLKGNEPSNLEEQALCLVGRDIYEKLIKEYTEKQWGRPCKELPAFIIRRLPMRYVFDNNYFDDKYQGIPVGGYNKLIESLLKDSDIRVSTNFYSSFIPNMNETYRVAWRYIADKLVYTGPLDEYFGYAYGKLEWRTVEFKTRVEDTANYQGNAVINYTGHEVPYTRIIEHKHFEYFGNEVYANPITVISEEYSTEYKEGMEQYYPVNNQQNNKIANKYRDLALKENNVIFGGRLGQYKYFDMAPIIEQAFAIEI